MTDGKVMRSIKRYVDSLEVKIVFSEPTNFNPIKYPELEEMGKWSHDRVRNTLTLQTKHLIDYNERDLVQALTDSRVDPYKYAIESKTFADAL
ncbi:alpha-amylase family protein [Companilactobacillus hulinensis]|uniref:hypothetical protein n=1 Tax=Companilactobacillus hulinensis TaxID=2486007 RepID=UPI000F79EC97|nr:hypothetical protein [Companilactobacillus hulinensis]